MCSWSDPNGMLCSESLRYKSADSRLVLSSGVKDHWPLNRIAPPYTPATVTAAALQSDTGQYGFRSSKNSIHFQSAFSSYDLASVGWRPKELCYYFNKCFSHATWKKFDFRSTGLYQRSCHGRCQQPSAYHSLPWQEKLSLFEGW